MQLIFKELNFKNEYFKSLTSSKITHYTITACIIVTKRVYFVVQSQCQYIIMCDQPSSLTGYWIW